MTKNVLVLTKDSSTYKSIEKLVRKEGYLHLADNLSSLHEKLQERVYDLLVLDLSPELPGIKDIKSVLEENPVPSVILADQKEVNPLLREVDNWSTRYLMIKPFLTDELKLTIEKALEKKRLIDEVKFLRREVITPHDTGNIITKNRQMEVVIEAIKDVAPTNATVLIEGETGTGKELIAKSIHFMSPRKDRPFVAINCGALPDTLLESELFGHEKGSFTGATTRRLGKFEYARGGTIFLDEVENMSAAMQVKLLRVIEEKEFTRLGDNKPIMADVRIIAASNEKLEECVNQGSFRKDLFYRLNIISLGLPPLRERKEDIPLLAAYFLSKHQDTSRQQVTSISEEAMESLLNYDWPGNIRELENIIERAVLLEKGNVISSFPLKYFPFKGKVVGLEPNRDQTLKAFRKEITAKLEKEYLQWVLTRFKGKVSQAAQFAGITPRALYGKMQRYELRKEDFK